MEKSIFDETALKDDKTRRLGEKHDSPKVLRFSMDINSALSGNFLEKGVIERERERERDREI